jgi:signal recognition particle subunit SRP54
MIVKIVNDELVGLLGGKAVTMQIKGSPEIVMVCGLQGSGKTTAVAKLANHLRKIGRRPLVSSVDVHRPAAIDQLRVLAEKHEIDYFLPANVSDPLKITRGALDALSQGQNDILIMDTAGRLHVDEDMMNELADVTSLVKPEHVLFVADGMTGQDAVNAVEGFMKYITFDGVILTKIDGDARGGAALSIREVTGKPILFVGNGERIDAFDVFHPDRFASRILGMGDIVSLVEKAQEVVDAKEAERLQKKMMTEGLTLEDFLSQIRQIRNMGSLEHLISMIPGVGKAMKGMDLSGEEFTHVEAIILSMTPDERKMPSIINGSRRKRIAQGSGTSIQDVNNLLKQFYTMQKMMKRMSKFGGRMKPPPGMRMPF